MKTLSGKTMKSNRAISACRPCALVWLGWTLLSVVDLNSQNQTVKETVFLDGKTVAVAASASQGWSSCSCSINPTSKYVAGGGESGVVSITAGSQCLHSSASNNPDWIMITSGQTGSGSATLGYTVQPNYTGSYRIGSVTVAGNAFRIRQPAGSPPCSYSIAPTNVNIGGAGGQGAVGLTATAGCAWTASSNVSWAAIGAGESGTGNGAVLYAVAPNMSGEARSGSLTIAGQTFTINQAGAQCDQACMYSCMMVYGDPAYCMAACCQ